MDSAKDAQWLRDTKSSIDAAVSANRAWVEANIQKGIRVDPEVIKLTEKLRNAARKRPGEPKPRRLYRIGQVI